MCSIIGSFSKEKVIELIELNQHRGNFSYSISTFDTDNNVMTDQIKSFGSFDKEVLGRCSDKENIYYICHVQAPTGGLMQDPKRIHPTNINDTFLWHNGIIKSRSIKKLQAQFITIEEFDTALLHKVLPNWKELSTVEGLFSCAYVNKEGLHLFRTKHGQLHIDKDMNISSERFEGSKCINYDTIYQVDLKEKQLKEIDSFNTKRFNIVVPGEL